MKGRTDAAKKPKYRKISRAERGLKTPLPAWWWDGEKMVKGTMEEPKEIICNGTRVKTHGTLFGTAGMFVTQEAVKARKVSELGTIVGWVAGHGGDVYWVRHDSDNQIGAYGWWEFDYAKAQPSDIVFPDMSGV